MAVVPSTQITFYESIPFPRNYNSTLWFTSVQAQRNFYNNYSNKVVFDNVRYQKLTKKCQINMQGNPFVYNYMSFVNPDGMTFYCFIDDVDYLSNNCYEFGFTIDILQTYMQLLVINPCFVERHHVNDDTPGYNTVAEQFAGYGQYVYETIASPYVGDPNVPTYPNEIAFYNANSIIICVATSFALTDLSSVSGIDFIIDIQPGYKNGTYHGLHIICFEQTQFESVNNLITQATEDNLVEGIITIFMCPQAAIYQEVSGERRGSDFELKVDGTKLGKYTPKNKKLLTYPYNMLYVTNNEGNAQNYKFEYFDKYEQDYGRVFFCMDSTINCNPVIGVFPRNYEGLLYNYNEILTTSSYPTCAWTSDIFKAYIAQNTGKLIAGAVNLTIDTLQGVSNNILQNVEAAVTLGLGGDFVNPIDSVLDTGQQVISTLGNMYDISTLPPQAHGNDTSSLNLAMDVKGFEFIHTYLNSETAKIIDDYFSMYGYAINSIATPNVTGRRNWNYVKVKGQPITGKAPASVLSMINQIFNTGVTLWHNYATYNDYTQPNPII